MLGDGKVEASSAVLTSLFLLQIFLILGPFLIFRLEESSADEPVAQAF